MARDVALTCLVLAGFLFIFGLVIGTSQYLGQLLAWGLMVLLILVAAIAGIRAVLLDHFPPKG